MVVESFRRCGSDASLQRVFEAVGRPGVDDMGNSLSLSCSAAHSGMFSCVLPYVPVKTELFMGVSKILSVVVACAYRPREQSMVELWPRSEKIKLMKINENLTSYCQDDMNRSLKNVRANTKSELTPQ